MSGTGINGSVGGCGGGGGGADQQQSSHTHGLGGAISNGTNAVNVYAGGATIELSYVGLAGADGPDVGGNFDSKGGHGGGADHSTASWGILNDITGSSVRYAYPGRGGNNSVGGGIPPDGPAFRTPGTGGFGGDDDLDTNMTAGQDGIIVVKTYNF